MAQPVAATARFLCHLAADLAGALLRRWRRFHARVVRGEPALAVAIDVRPALERTSGIGWYLWNLVEALDGRADGVDFNLYATAFLSAEEPLPELPVRHMRVRVHRLPDGFLLPATPALGLLRSCIAPLQRALDGNDVALTADLSGLGDTPPSPEPMVATVHDLAFAAMPGSVDRREVHRMRTELPARLYHCSRFIAVSDATAEDLAEHLGVSRRRVHTIHEGVEPRFRPPQPDDEPVLELPDRYLLFVSNLEPRKNLVNVLRAYRLVVEWGYPGELILVGEWRGPSASIRAELDTSPVADRVVHRTDITRDTLPELYRRADALLMPSWLEGFGLPLVEAMASGTPVVTSGRSAMPEVAGPAAVYVDPASPHGIASAVTALLADPQHRRRLTRQGLERATRFSWERTAAATVEALRETVGIGSNGDDEYRV